MNTKDRLFVTEKPLFINYNLNFECIMKCKMCSMWKMKPFDKMAISIMKEHFRALREWMGPFEINVNGGEPLLSEHIFDVLRYFISIGIRPNISTNGYLLNETVSRYLLETGLSCINISFDGFEEVHDYLRGKKGAFKRVISGIENLTKINPDISIHCQTVLNSKNLGSINEFIAWLQKNTPFDQVNFQAIAQPFGEDTDSEWYLKSDLWPTDTKIINNAIDSIISYKNSGPYICNSLKQLESYRSYFLNPKAFNYSKCYIGHVAYSVTPNGFINCCPYKKAIGKVDMSPNEVWNSEESKKQRASYIDCKENCHLLVNCAFEDRI